MDVSALITFLAPALGFLLGVGEQVAEQAKGKLGDAAWESARRLWHRLRPKIDDDPAAKAAVETLAEDPDDVEARAALTFLLRRVLADDPDLARLLEEEWESARTQTTAIASAERSVALAGRNTGNVIITGDRDEPAR